MKIDLHMHTTASDGMLTPPELVGLAIRRGLGLIAITDHDTFEGVVPAQVAAEGTKLRVACGIELTVAVPVGQLHLLAYFPAQPSGDLPRRLAGVRELRRARAEQIVERLGELGAPISWDRVAERAAGTVGRPHIAEELVHVGHVASREEAFDRYLADDAPAFVPSTGLEPEEAIGLVRGSGGAPVLAHPTTLRLDADGLDRMIERLTRAGLIGIEVHRPEHNMEERRRYRWLADRYGLVPAGGSDFHAGGYRFDLGETGDPPLPAETLTRLFDRAPSAPPSASVSDR